MIKNLYSWKNVICLLCLFLIAGTQQIHAAPYCTPATGHVFASAQAKNVITAINVPFTGLNSAIGTNANGYTSVVFSGGNPVFHQGSTYVVSATVANAGDVAAWIDFNRDSTFQNSEMVPMTISGTSAMGTVTVPATASLGTTRFRIMGAEKPNALLGPCGNTTRGEAEDYLIEIIGPTTCAVPTGLASTNVVSTYGRIKWTGTSGSYQYALGKSDSIPTNNINNTSIDSVSFGGLTGGTKYYYYVRSICGPTDFSPWVLDSFTTPVCNGPSFILSGVTDSTAVLGWTPGLGAIATEYAVNTFVTGPNGPWAPAPPSPYKITGLTHNKKYYVHMRSVCPNNDSSEFSSVSFTTTRLSVNSINGNMASCYPNPVKDILNVVLNDDAVITIYDVAGRELLRADSKDKQAGIDMKSFADGVYFLRCANSEQSATLRVVKSGN
jgi:hypothetical protein